MLETIIFSRDRNLISTMQSVCGKLSIDTLICSDSAKTAALISKKKIYALLMDDADVPSAAASVAFLRRSSSSREALSVFIGRTQPGSIIEAALSIPKPLSVEVGLRTIRAARGVMYNEFRRYVRHSTQIPVSAKLPGRQLQAKIINISDGGMGLEFTSPQVIAPGMTLQMQFVLPVSDESVQVTGDVVWCNENGRAGMRYRCASQIDKDRMQTWLCAQLIPYRLGPA